MRLLIADDHDLVRDAIAAFLEKDGAAQVTTIGSLGEVRDLLQAGEIYDLVLLDYAMPGMNGLDGLRTMLKVYPKQPFALISGTAQPMVAHDAIEAGAIGFIPKSMPARSIIGAISLMVSGSVFAPFEFMQQSAAPEIGDLTDREAAVLQGVCEGKTNKEIARDLGLQEVTVKLHMRNVCRKMDARNRTHAAMIAQQNGWF